MGAKKHPMMNALVCSRPNSLPVPTSDTMRMLFDGRPIYWQVIKTADSAVLMPKPSITLRKDRNYEIRRDENGHLELRLADGPGALDRPEIGEVDALEVLHVADDMRRAWEVSVAGIIADLAALRGAQEPWPGESRPRCEELACGFVDRCHVEPVRIELPAGQLDLFGDWRAA